VLIKIPNIRKIFQIALKYNNIFPPKFPQIWIFGLKRNHLVTLPMTLFSVRVARFFLLQHTKTGGNIPDDQKYTIQVYQMAINYIKCPENLPNSHKIYQHCSLQDPPKFTQIGIFGLRIYHLATPYSVGALLGKCKSMLLFQKNFFSAKESAKRLTIIIFITIMY
jgi:hypothetical protein